MIRGQILSSASWSHAKHAMVQDSIHALVLSETALEEARASRA
jgi:hypothetical protein